MSKKKCTCVIPTQNYQSCTAFWTNVVEPQNPRKTSTGTPVPPQFRPTPNVQATQTQQAQSSQKANLTGKLIFSVAKGLSKDFGGRYDTSYHLVNFFAFGKYFNPGSDVVVGTLEYKSAVELEDLARAKPLDLTTKLETLGSTGPTPIDTTVGFGVIPYTEFAHGLKPGVKYSFAVRYVLDDYLSSDEWQESPTRIVTSDWVYFSLTFTKEETTTPPFRKAGDFGTVQ